MASFARFARHDVLYVAIQNRLLLFLFNRILAKFVWQRGFYAKRSHAFYLTLVWSFNARKKANNHRLDKLSCKVNIIMSLKHTLKTNSVGIFFGRKMLKFTQNTFPNIMALICSGFFYRQKSLFFHFLFESEKYSVECVLI